jgi:hypothetical protein
MTQDQIERIEAGFVDNPVITFRSLYNKASVLTVQPVWSNQQHRFLGIPKEDSDAIFKYEASDKTNLPSPYIPTYKITDGAELDTSIPQQKACWEYIKWNDTLAGSLKEAFSGNALFYIYEPEKESRMVVDFDKKKYRFRNWLYEKAGADDIYNMCELLGVSMRNQSLTEAQSFIISTADKRLDDVLNLIESPNTATLLFINKLKRKGLIRDINNNGTYVYNNETITINGEKGLIEWINNPRNYGLVELLQRECYPERFVVVDEKDHNSADKVISAIKKNK